MKLEKFENELLDCKIGTFITNENEIYFRGKDIASYLQYADTTHAIRYNVDDDDKSKLEELWGATGIQPLTSNGKKYYLYKCKWFI